MTTRFGRWQQLIIDALAQHETAGLQLLLEHHLDRRPTRAESIAAQRAARLLAQGGHAGLTRVRVANFKGRHGVQLLVVARPDLNLATVSAEVLRLAATGSTGTANQTDKVLSEIVTAVEKAASQIAAVDLNAVDAEAAGRSARALAVSLRKLTLLRQVLTTRRSLR